MLPVNPPYAVVRCRKAQQPPLVRDNPYQNSPPQRTGHVTEFSFATFIFVTVTTPPTTTLAKRAGR